MEYPLNLSTNNTESARGLCGPVMLVALGLPKIGKSQNQAAKESGVTQQRISYQPRKSILPEEQNTLVTIADLELSEKESSNAQVLAEANKT